MRQLRLLIKKERNKDIELMRSNGQVNGAHMDRDDGVL